MNNQYKLYLTGFFLILFLPLLAISPWFFPPEWGKAMAFRVVFSLILFLFIWQLTSHESFFRDVQRKFITNKKAILILLFISLMAGISTLFSEDLTFSLFASPHRSGGFISFVSCIFLAIGLFLIVREREWQKLLDVTFFVADIVVLFAMVQYFDLFPNLFVAYGGRPPSTLSNPILLAIYLILLIFPLLSSAIKEKTQKRFFYWGSLALFFFGLFVSGSRAAYLGAIIGGFYFVILFPKKLKKTKLITSAVLLLLTLGIFYISSAPTLPSFIENNPRLSYLAERVSLDSIFEALGQTRFSAWKTFSGAVLEKPIFGWGAENQAIAFDKYYDPDLDYLVKLGEEWWDRAHNIFLDLSLSYGIPFLILYLLFFGYIFWRLQTTKKEQPEKRISCHAIQASFIAYFIALLFGFDSMTTYLTLFFIVGYALFLISRNDSQNQSNQTNAYYPLFRKRKFIIGTALVLMIFFLWKGALIPLYVNGQINAAESSDCKKGLESMEKLLDSKSFIDSYLRLKYVEYIKTCSNYISDNEVTYINKAIKALKEEATLQPKYTRTWIMLTQFNSTLLAMAQTKEEQEVLEKESLSFVAAAKKISPLRQEIYAAETGIYFAQKDFTSMKRVAEECIIVDKNAGACYWYLGLAEIMMGNTAQGIDNIETAKRDGYEYDNTVSLTQLALAYSQNKNYNELIEVYQRLLEFNPKNLDFRATLAFIYREVGQYQKAKEEALKLIHEHPTLEGEVREFLTTLPYPYSVFPEEDFKK